MTRSFNMLLDIVPGAAGIIVTVLFMLVTVAGGIGYASFRKHVTQAFVKYGIYSNIVHSTTAIIMYCVIAIPLVFIALLGLYSNYRSLYPEVCDIPRYYSDAISQGAESFRGLLQRCPGSKLIAQARVDYAETQYIKGSTCIDQNQCASSACLNEFLSSVSFLPQHVFQLDLDILRGKAKNSICVPPALPANAALEPPAAKPSSTPPLSPSPSPTTSQTVTNSATKVPALPANPALESPAAVPSSTPSLSPSPSPTTSQIVTNPAIKAPSEAQTIFDRAVAASQRKDYVTARSLFRQLAERGDTASMLILGSLYEEAKGGNQDIAEAVRWYTNAAEGGNADAMSVLGFMYQFSHVPQDCAAAELWYRRSAQNGSVTGMYNLGKFLEIGCGSIGVNPVEARKWLHMAADRGSSDARTVLDRIGN